MGMLARVNRFHDQVAGTNWGDYFNLVQDVPFWESELEKIDTHVQPYLSDPEIGEAMKRTHRLMDCMYACEDVRDFMNEIGELCARAASWARARTPARRWRTSRSCRCT